MLVQNIPGHGIGAAAEIHQLGMVHGAVGFLAYLEQGGAVAGVREGQLQILRLEMELFFRVEEIVQQAQDEFIIVALEQGTARVFGLYDGL